MWILWSFRRQPRVRMSSCRQSEREQVGVASANNLVIKVVYYSCDFEICKPCPSLHLWDVLTVICHIAHRWYRLSKRAWLVDRICKTAVRMTGTQQRSEGITARVFWPVLSIKQGNGRLTNRTWTCHASPWNIANYALMLTSWNLETRHYRYHLVSQSIPQHQLFHWSSGCIWPLPPAHSTTVHMYEQGASPAAAF